MLRTICLNDIQVGQTFTVRDILCTGNTRRRLSDLGIIPNTKVECIGKSPLGDPTALLIRGVVYALRNEDLACILV